VAASHVIRHEPSSPPRSSPANRILKIRKARDVAGGGDMLATKSTAAKAAPPSPVRVGFPGHIFAGGGPHRLAGYVGLKLKNVGTIFPFEGRANPGEPSRIPETEIVRVLSCGCTWGLNIREDSRPTAFDISTPAAAPGPAGLCGRAKQAAQSRAARTLLQLANQPTSATRSWAAASAAVAGCAGSWSTVAC